MQMTHEARSRRDLVALAVASVCIVGTFYAVASIYAWSLSQFGLASPVPSGLGRILSSLMGSLVLPLVLTVLRVAYARTVWIALLGIVPAAMISGACRTGMQVATGTIPLDTRHVTVEAVSGVVFALGASVLAHGYMAIQRAERVEARAAANAAYQRELALRTLETEEVRVRRSIAEGLHGSLQQRLVIAAVQVDMFIEETRRRGLGEEDVQALMALRRDLDDIRENDVRATSRMLYPEGIEIGLVPAVRMLLRRLPAGISTRLHVGERLRELDDPGNSAVRPSDRLLVVRVVEEAVTNGLRHGHATSFDVTLDVEDALTIVVDVANNGSSVDMTRATHGSGTRRLQERVALAGGTLVVGSDVEASRIDSGEVDGRQIHHAHLRARIPVSRENITGLGHLPSED